MSCTVSRGKYKCNEAVYQHGTLCKYHTRGGCMVSRSYFYSVNTDSWVLRDDPEYGDLKYDRQTMYKYDGKQWRKQCPLCEKFARPNFCVDHDSQVRKHKTNSKQSSLVACKFIDQLETVMNKKILHKHYDEKTDCFIGHEFYIPNTKLHVDGFVLGSSVVIEILGDYWHGNPAEYNRLDVNKTLQKTYGELFNLTFQRFQKISQHGFTILYAWESELDRDVANPASILKTFQPSDVVERKQ